MPNSFPIKINMVCFVKREQQLWVIMAVVAMAIEIV